MHLVQTSHSILQQLKDLVTQLNPAEYSAELELLSGNSIGKHLRHVVEFFDLLLNNSDGEVFSYDGRKHDKIIETEVEAAIELINKLEIKLNQIKEDKALILRASYSKFSNAPVELKTSLNRELAYNIEHAVHHMAIIKIAVITVFPNIKLDEGFGVAYSTIRYQKTN